MMEVLGINWQSEKQPKHSDYKYILSKKSFNKESSSG